MRKLGQKRNKVKPDNWDVYVATPAYDGKVETNYAQALCEASYCAPLFHVKLSAGVMGNGAFIDLARNIFVRRFLTDFPDATHLFFIDADLKFPPEAFIGLIRSGLPIVAGVYPKRQEPEEYPVRWVENPDMGGLWIEDGFLMCDRVPTGFLCISRKVIEEMAADAVQLNISGEDGPVPQLFYTKLDEENRFVGEDYCFCDDYVKRYGKPIHVWPDIDFVHGGYAGNLAGYLANKIEEQKKAEDAA